MASFGIGGLGGAQSGGGIYGGNLMIRQFGMLKSTRDQLQRQQQTANEVAYWEKQKETLKDRECETVEEIAEKLDALHKYEDQIDAVKKAYNYEQMFHALDEAKERGEKIAEAVEKTEPKTEEERKEEAKEEAVEAVTGEEAGGGMLEDMLEGVEDLKELDAESLDKAAGAVENLEDVSQMTEALNPDMTAEAVEQMEAAQAEQTQQMEEFNDLAGQQKILEQEQLLKQQKQLYVPFDMRV